ncbi:NUC185 domain-containing protein [Chytriomyces sp. MP71]|nr:NUC185 domain-containing protein [Chytriomyces sp. MP71]
MSLEASLAEVALLDSAPSETAVLDIPFTFTQTGASSSYIAVPDFDGRRRRQLPPQSSNLPLSLGASEFEDHRAWLESKFLKPSNALDSSSLTLAQRMIYRDPNIANLLQARLTKPRTTLRVQRNLATLDVDFSSFEETLLENTDSNATNSTSFLREPSSHRDFVRGASTNMPFAPGGLEKIILKDDAMDQLALDLDELLNLDSDGLKTIPPGFDRGLVFEDSAKSSSYTHQTSLNIHDILAGGDQDDFGLFDAPTVVANEPALASKDKAATAPAAETSLSAEVDDLIPTRENVPTITVGGGAAKVKKEQHKEWAYVVDVNQPFPDFKEKVPELAHKFPFELDLFQKRAVYHLENGESVFVAAHTSAGKTVVAEYAIALAQKHMTRTIYTSPIKALSNQKFRDFKDRFEDVGILTGDVQIKPEASCLIMTTEILRSMLYRGADLIRDVEFVIFDEVHYVNDAERGVVWEEVIIMLPAHVTLILLSATVPNTKEFADWVGRTKKRDIYVISTLKRPVPLEHHLYVDKEIFKIVGAEKKFLSIGWKAAHDHLPSSKRAEVKADARPTGRGDGGRGRGAGGARGGSSQRSGGQGGRAGGGGGNNSFSRDLADRNMYVNIISLLKKRGLVPVIVFSFSKRKCEEYANALVNLDLTAGSGEKSEIHVFIERSLARLKGTDRQLPQVLRIRELLSRGIAVHHGGLLPIIKEMVEILFTRGLVKVLFATETFAMGVNAPARAVVFSSTRKHDGRNFRELLPGEYTQMSGRAGRRGLDDTGVVIIACNDDVPEPSALNSMILGVPTKLESQFRLTYTMILNLLRVEALKVEEMIKRSFSENTSQKMLPEQQSMYDESAKALSNLAKLSCSICSPDIGSFYDASSKIVLLGHQLREKIMRSPIGPKVATPGRVIVVNSGFYRNIVGVILKAGTVPPASVSSESMRREAQVDGRSFIVLAVVEKMEPAAYAAVDLSPMPVTRVSLPTASRQSFEIIAIPYSDMSLITKHTLKVEQDLILDTRSPSEIARVGQMLVNLAEEMTQEGKIPENDWSKIREMEFQEKEKEKNSLLAKLSLFQCSKCPDLVEHYGMIHNERQLEVQLAELAHNISDQNLELLPDYHQRIEVLKVLNFIDENSTVQIKGRVACEINTADELILTELILENFLADYEPAEIVALLSCFVFQEKSQNQPVLTARLERGIEEIKTIAQKVHSVQKVCGLDVGGPEDAIAGLKFGLVEVVYEWARGMSFKEITDLTDVLEGSIVRCIVRLDETCREVRGASRIIGDSNLHRKMEDAAESIRRDIVFAASLYF